MVSSMRVTSSSLTSTISGQAEMVGMFSDMMVIGFSLDHIPGRSAYSVTLSQCS